MPVDTILLAAFGPALVAGVFLLPWMPWAKKPPSTLLRFSAAVGVLGAYLLSQAVLEGFPAYPPVDSGNWVTFLGIGLIAFALLPGLEELNGTETLPIRIAVVGAGVALVWRPLIENTWETTPAVLTVFGTVALMLAAWSSLETFAARRPGAPFPVAMLLLLSGISVITVLDESLKYGMFFGALAASQGAAAVVGFWGGRFKADGAYALVLFGLMFSLLAATHAWVYYEPTYNRFLLYFAAMLSAGGLEYIKPFARMPTLKREGLRLSVILLFLGIALAISIAGQGGAEDDYGYY
ncbi:MAG: hypothetical protein AAFU77_11385 [Myxococcota bacterium]